MRRWELAREKRVEKSECGKCAKTQTKSGKKAEGRCKTGKMADQNPEIEKLVSHFSNKVTKFSSKAQPGVYKPSVWRVFAG